MANRFPLVVNIPNNTLEELPIGDNINLTLSGIYDGISTGTANQVLTSTGTSVSWKNINQLASEYIATETDPIFNASPAKNITVTNISNWDTAYSWGNHASIGYLISETDPIFNASPAKNITVTNISNWNSAYNWGNHASAGYLTSYTETDTLASVTARGATTTQSITVGDLTVTGNFIVSGDTTTLNTQNLKVQDNEIVLNSSVIGTPALNAGIEVERGSLPNVKITWNETTDKWTFTNNGTNYYNFPINVSELNNDSGYISSYTETDPIFNASPAKNINNQQISNWNSAYNWGNHASAGYLTSYTETDPIFTNSVAAGITIQKVSQWNSAYNWGNHASAGYLTSLSSQVINSLNDVIISSPTNGQILQYNGTNWVNAAVASGGGGIYTETDTLSTVTSRGASTSVTCTFQDLIVSGNLNVTGNTTQNNVTNLNVSNNEIIINSGQETGTLNAFIKNDRGSDPDTAIRWNEVSDRWQFTNDGVNYFNIALDTLDLTNNAGYLTSTGSIDTHTDVNIASPTSGQILSYNGSEWVNISPDLEANAYVSNTSPVDPEQGDLWWKSDEKILKIYDSINGALQWYNTSVDLNTVYANVAYFPGADVSKGAFAYSDTTGAMYYSNGVSWTSQRVVTTNSSTTSDFATLLANTQLKYSISASDYTGGSYDYNNDRKIIKLTDTQGVNSSIILTAGTGLSIVRSENEITITNDISFTYGISSETATGTNAKFRLSRSDGTNDDITFVGADGLSVERTDANTITFRAPETVVTQYTDEMAQDAAAALLVNGTHTNITFTYNDETNSIDAVAGAQASIINTTYDLVGSNTTSNNAILSLTGNDETTDSIQFVGGNGTNVSWDNSNATVTISSTAPVNADWNSTTGLSRILNKPTIPPAYSLPIATAETLGGIKIGANLSIDANGILSANPGSYNLPIASAGTLGGIKIGSGLTIDGNGVLTATGSSSVPQIQDLTSTTNSLAVNQTSELNITGYKAYSLFKITTNAEAWVRIYVDDASRDADATRSEGEDPVPGDGVIAEVRTSGAQAILITPGIMGFNNDSPRTNTIYLAVTNRSNTARTITVTLTALQIGE